MVVTIRPVGPSRSIRRGSRPFGVFSTVSYRTRPWLPANSPRGVSLTFRCSLSPAPVVTLRDAAKRWQASRVDVRENTRIQHRTALGRLLPILGSLPVDRVTPADVAALVTELAGMGKARESISVRASQRSRWFSIMPASSRTRPETASPRTPPPRTEDGDRSARRGTCARSPRRVAASVSVAAARPRRDRNAARRTRTPHLGRRRQAPPAVARVSGRLEDEPSEMGTRAPTPVCRRARALPARRSRSREARDRRVRRRRVPHSDRTGMHRRRRPRVLAARPTPPADLAAPPRRRPLGPDRRARRTAEPRRHREPPLLAGMFDPFTAHALVLKPEVRSGDPWSLAGRGPFRAGRRAPRPRRWSTPSRPWASSCGASPSASRPSQTP